MSQGFSVEWHEHQRKFLAHKLAALATADAVLKLTLKEMIKLYSPPSCIERIVSFFDSAQAQVADDPVKADCHKHYCALKNDLYNKPGRSTYEAERRRFEAKCLEQIEARRSISPYVKDLDMAATDVRKSQRLMDYFASFSPKIGSRVGRQLCIDTQPPITASSAYERAAALWDFELKVHLPVDHFFSYNETDAFEALDQMFTDAGGRSKTIPAGTHCAHAGVFLNRCIILDDHILCWATTDDNQALNYARLVVSDYELKPVYGYLPQLVKGMLDNDLNCAVMTGTCFDVFGRVFCNDSHDMLSSWILYWCSERGFDALLGTNFRDHELMIRKPHHNVSWEPWVRLPQTKAAFDQQYGNPPSFAYKARVP